MSSLFKLSFPDFPPVFPFFTQMQLQLSWPWTSAESFKCASNMCQTFDPCLSSRSYRFSQYKKYLMYLNEWQWILKLPWQMSSDPSVKYFFTLYLSVFFRARFFLLHVHFRLCFFLFHKNRELDTLYSLYESEPKSDGVWVRGKVKYEKKSILTYQVFCCVCAVFLPIAMNHQVWEQKKNP